MYLLVTLTVRSRMSLVINLIQYSAAFSVNFAGLWHLVGRIMYFLNLCPKPFLMDFFGKKNAFSELLMRLLRSHPLPHIIHNPLFVTTYLYLISITSVFQPQSITPHPSPHIHHIHYHGTSSKLRPLAYVIIIITKSRQMFKSFVFLIS